MADDTILKNANNAPFVESEADAGEGSIYPGNFLEYAADGDVQKHSGEAGVDTAAVGMGLIADLSFDPDDTIDDAYDADERVRTATVPVGGEVYARVEAGGDLTTGSEANLTTGDPCAEGPTGGLMLVSGNNEVGAVYVALEDVDNSGAAAGVTNQVRALFRRVA